MIFRDVRHASKGRCPASIETAPDQPHGADIVGAPNMWELVEYRRNYRYKGFYYQASEYARSKAWLNVGRGTARTWIALNLNQCLG
jgi:hypothetical protein